MKAAFEAAGFRPDSPAIACAMLRATNLNLRACQRVLEQAFADMTGKQLPGE